MWRVTAVKSEGSNNVYSSKGSSIWKLQIDLDPFDFINITDAAMGEYAHEEKVNIQETLRVRRPVGITCKSRESGEHTMSNTDM